MPRPRKEFKQTPSSIRIPPGLLTEVKKVAGIMKKSDAEMIRMSTEIGLEQLRKIDYRVAKAVVDMAEMEVEKKNPAPRRKAKGGTVTG